MSANDYSQQMYQSAANQAADDYGVPRSIFNALIDQESGWNISAVSNKGAVGLTQLMPGTSQQLGVTNAYDPVQNLRGGAAYLAQQFKNFGSWSNALIAYNAGPGTYQAAQSGNGTANQQAAFSQGTTYAQTVLGNAASKYGYDASGNATPGSVASDGTPSALAFLNDFKVFGYSPADIFNGVTGIPSAIVGATVGNIPGVGGIVQNATDALTGQNAFFANLMSGEWWRSNFLYLIVVLLIAALVWFSAGNLLKV